MDIDTLRNNSCNEMIIAEQQTANTNIDTKSSVRSTTINPYVTRLSFVCYYYYYYYVVVVVVVIVQLSCRNFCFNHTKLSLIMIHES